jgi:hypothetical protein
MFHAREGLNFERLPDGSVRVFCVIEKEVGNAKGGSPIILYDITLDANVWASVIASMSYYGEEDYGFYRAMNFHRGDEVPASCPLVDKLKPA